jgi:hypothetical protein
VFLKSPRAPLAIGEFMGLLGRFKAPKGTVSVTLEKGEYSLREPLTGKINVSAAEDFDIDEVRLEIWVNEFTRASQSQNVGGTTRSVTAQQDNVIHNAKTTVSGRIHASNGFSQDFPFSINLPSGVPPTYRGRNANNSWKIKGVLAVKGRPDITGHETEIQVNP